MSEPMSLTQFRATKYPVSAIDCVRKIGYGPDYPFALIYADGFVIEWDAMSTYRLDTENRSDESKDLEYLERELYQYAVESGGLKAKEN